MGQMECPLWPGHLCGSSAKEEQGMMMMMLELVPGGRNQGQSMACVPPILMAEVMVARAVTAQKTCMVGQIV